MSFYNQIHDTVAALVMFYSPTDKASMQMMKVIDDLKSKISGSAQVITVNVDEDTRTASREDLTELPTFAVYRYGRCHWRKSGIVPEQELLDHLEASADPTPANELGRHHAKHA